MASANSTNPRGSAVPPTPATVAQLEKKYAEQVAIYESYIKDAIRTKNPDMIEKIKALNVSIAATLDAMIAHLATVKEETANSKMYRDDLVAKLSRIQSDYNGLQQDTDKLETLRRIREFETSNINESVFTYLVIFLIGVLVVLLIIFVKGSQKSDTAATMPSMPATAMPLT